MATTRDKLTHSRSEIHRNSHNYIELIQKLDRIMDGASGRFDPYIFYSKSDITPQGQKRTEVHTLSPFDGGGYELRFSARPGAEGLLITIPDLITHVFFVLPSPDYLQASISAVGEHDRHPRVITYESSPIGFMQEIEALNGPHGLTQFLKKS